MCWVAPLRPDNSRCSTPNVPPSESTDTRAAACLPDSKATSQATSCSASSRDYARSADRMGCLSAAGARLSKMQHPCGNQSEWSNRSNWSEWSNRSNWSEESSQPRRLASSRDGFRQSVSVPRRVDITHIRRLGLQTPRFPDGAEHKAPTSSYNTRRSIPPLRPLARVDSGATLLGQICQTPLWPATVSATPANGVAETGTRVALESVARAELTAGIGEPCERQRFLAQSATCVESKKLIAAAKISLSKNKNNHVRTSD